MNAIIISGLAVVMTIVTAVASGQQAAPAPAPSEALVTCMEAQRRALGLLEAIDRRVETARQTNSPTELRAAVADLQRGVLGVRMELGRCAKQGPGAGPADPHGGHAQAGTRTP